MTSTTEYADLVLLHVDRLVDAGEKSLRTSCPECGSETPDPADHDLVVDEAGDAYVAIGCEGYWVVDPAALGLDRGGWSDANGETPTS